MSSAIRADGLGKRFRHTAALDSLDLDVPAGAIYALAGPPGAGKSTCLKLLLNILPPSAGRAEVLDIDSRRLTPADFVQIGYLSATQQMPSMTVGDYLHFLSGFYPAWDPVIESALIRRFQLLLDSRLPNLSPSARMKTALVSNLAYRPKLILLDDPLRELDALSRAEFLEALREHAGGATILFSTGDPAEVEAFATHLSYLERGRLRFSEDLTALRARFREIVLTFDAAAPLPADWPAGWLRPERGPSTLRFLESRFDAEGTPAEARRRFPGVRDFAANPMILKDIVSALVPPS